MTSKRASRELRDLHGAIVDLMVFMNRPQRDDALLKEAGVGLERALFPLLVAIDRFGPIGVVELGERVGRDYTTMSRQLMKLDKLGLIERRPGPIDRRVSEAAVSDEGRRLIHRLVQARERLAEPVLKKWSEEDFSTLVRLLRRLVEDLDGLP